ncbi:tetratricopeptide repeat protein [Nocardia uniformis]|uniref:Tetratricopeptide repeat protein n=1 Tax=Nocardia uniformis TaxID=53432 RepID=A0A849CJP0_9NOCA|nr:tetratricopeptide repeat protein [Nocardia uniformis]NNH74811.1 tetratricopeptide repeat protein [Nocardia uniformis]
MSQNGETDDYGAETRKRLRRILLGTGLAEHELVEPLAVELQRHGCRPRKAWRLANGFTLDVAAGEYNRANGDERAAMTSARISEFESWPRTRGNGRDRPRPTVDTLKVLATIYRASWDQLLDSADLTKMPARDLAAYRAAVARRCTASPVVEGRGLPWEIAPFIGRHDQRVELHRRVSEHLSGHRPAVHVVSGLAGVGKTALARYLVGEYGTSRYDGFIWEDLRGHSDGRTPRTPAGVLEQLLLRIGVPPETIENDAGRRADRWRTEMRDRRMLIVFDNALDSKQVRELLPHAPGCFVLITSRHKLTGLAGAAPMQLDAMTTAEAEELLVKLSHLPPGYDVGAVRRILETAGRLPLAIRLVAGQIAHYGPDMLAAADRDFQQLIDRVQHAPIGTPSEESLAAPILDFFSAEGESLGAAFELSYQRLSEPELRRAVRLLGLFPGSEITAETLAPMAAVTPLAANALIRRIFEVGLLDPAVNGPFGQRYRIHDVTRLFARKQADQEDLPSERAAAIARLVRFCLTIARRVGAPRPFDLAGSFPNMPVPDPSGTTERAREWLTQEREVLLGCIRVAGSGPDTGELARLLASHLSELGHWSDARWLFVRGLDIARGIGDATAECDVLYGLGTVHRLACDYETASKCFEEAHGIATRTDDQLRMASALWGYAEVTRHIGDYGSARDAYVDVLGIARKLQNLKFEGDSLRGLGHIERMGGDPATARHYYEAALDIAEQIGDRYSLGWSLWGLANITRMSGDFTAARAQFEESRAMGTELGDPLLQVDALRGLGHIARDLGDLDAAQGDYSDSLDVARRNGDPHGEADAWRALAGIAATSGRRHRPRACEFLRKSLVLYESMGVKGLAEQVRIEMERLDCDSWE